MNTGGGGGAYNKNVKRKPASLLLTKPAPNGIGLSAVNGKSHVSWVRAPIVSIAIAGENQDPTLFVEVDTNFYLKNLLCQRSA